MCHINFLLLFATQSKMNFGQNSFFVIFSKFFLVAVLLSISSTEKQSHFGTMFTCSVCGNSLLNECAHWSNASSQTNHHQRRCVSFGHDDSCSMSTSIQAQTIRTWFKSFKPS